jgi:tRNA dimethylallyltransferase
VPIKAILIAGPTASGKSGAGLELAARFGGTIINADSMQVYRELHLLTARPSKADEARVPYRLYGTVPAAGAYSVGRWLGDVARAMAEAHKEGRLPILVGGTGLYFKALTEGLAPVPDIPAEIRAHWRERSEQLGRDALHAELAARDPAMAARLGPNDPQRIVRALEVIDATGVSLAEWQGGNAMPLLAPGDALRLVIAPEREPLYAAIDARFDRMIEDGALDEVRALLGLDLDPGRPAMRAHGVRELAAYLSGALTREEAVAKAKTESRRYAKRQMTWLRCFMSDWDWFPDASTAVDAASTAMVIAGER